MNYRERTPEQWESRAEWGYLEIWSSKWRPRHHVGITVVGEDFYEVVRDFYQTPAEAWGESEWDLQTRTASSEEMSRTWGSPDSNWEIPTQAALEQIFNFMLEHDIPAVAPEELALEIRLLRAGVRIINKPNGVNP